MAVCIMFDFRFENTPKAYPNDCSEEQTSTLARLTSLNSAFEMLPEAAELGRQPSVLFPKTASLG